VRYSGFVRVGDGVHSDNGFNPPSQFNGRVRGRRAKRLPSHGMVPSVRPDIKVQNIQQYNSGADIGM